MSPILIFLTFLKFCFGGLLGCSVALILGFTMDWYFTTHDKGPAFIKHLENSFLFICTMGFLIGGVLICMP